MPIIKNTMGWDDRNASSSIIRLFLERYNSNQDGQDHDKPADLSFRHGLLGVRAEFPIVQGMTAKRVVQRGEHNRELLG